MRTVIIRLLVSFLLLVVLSTDATALAPAFPTAEGLGKWTQGGRGGQIIKVTNLNDSGPGSLRAAIEASGPRIVVFTVSGNIALGNTKLRIKNPYITIAGQTSPGGISVSGNQFDVSTHNVIIRHMRFRRGPENWVQCSGCDDSHADSLSLWGPGWETGVVINNVIIDHCSITWGVDETFSVTGGATNVTIQNNLIAQGLQYAKAGAPNQHSKGLMISGKVNPGWPGQNTTVSIYRNFMAHNEDRSPMMFNRETDNSNMVLDGVNNVIFNPHIRSITAGDAHVNWIGNFLKDGPWTSVTNSIMEIQSPAAESLLYSSGNLAMRKTGAVFKETTAEEWPFVTTQYPFNPVATTYQQLTRWEVAEPLTALPMTTTLAAEIVANAGANRIASSSDPVHDSVDAAIVSSYSSGADLRLNTVSYPADWPVYEQLPAPTDTDGDGMPDTWETEKGLNPTVANASAYTISSEYTDVEVYLNELAGEVFTPTYYVSPTGSVSNSGTSPASPWNLTKVNGFSFKPGDIVRLAEGDYGTTSLAPLTSGSAGNLITFTSIEGAATKPKLKGGVNLTGRNYIKIDGFDISSTGNAILINGGSNNVITNSIIYSSATSWVHAVALKNGAHYNKITNNTISQAGGNNDLINLRNHTNYNLIEGNTITIENSHAAIDLEGFTVDGGTTPIVDRSSNWNIIRRNTIIGRNGGGALINLNANSNYNMVDNNILKGDSNVANFCNLTSQPALHQDMFKLVGQYNIARNNILSNYPCKDAMGIEMSPYIYDGFTNNSIYQHVYHNVITGIGAGATPFYMFGYNGGELRDNVIKNNIIYNNGGTNWQPDNTDPLPTNSANLQLRDSPSMSSFTNNLIWKSGYTGPLVWLGSVYKTVDQANTDSALWDGNISADPMLDSTFHLTDGSLAANAGANLTTVTSASGSGTSFTVADAYYFCDGNGITTGDQIKVGDQLTTITEITYGSGLTGTLTVWPAIPWTQGAPVNLPYSGTAPHIGLSDSTATVKPGPIEQTSINILLRGRIRGIVR